MRFPSDPTTAQLQDPAFWEALCPRLSLSRATSPSSSSSSALSSKDLNGGSNRPRSHNDSAVESIREGVLREGFAVVAERCSGVPLELVDRLRNGIIDLVDSECPAPASMLYDEFWAVIDSARPLVEDSTENQINFDVLAWHVDARKGQAGFSPHRDRQPDNALASFRPADQSGQFPAGTPRYSTCWVALSDATPECGCLYAIPSFADPGYYAGDPIDGDEDPLQLALSTKEQYQHVRALAVGSGGAVVFSHRIIHWGSRGCQSCRHSRVSLSFGCADEGFEAPYISRTHLPYPPFEVRLALFAAQMIVYYQRFALSPSCFKALHRAFVQTKDAFDLEYRRKVEYEYVQAIKGGLALIVNDKQAAVPGVDSEEEEDMVDEALEAMLDAELEGWHDNEDDFDEIHFESTGSARLTRPSRRSRVRTKLRYRRAHASSSSGVLAGRTSRRRRRLIFGK